MGGILNLIFSQSGLFPIWAILNRSNSQLERFSNAAILKQSDSQTERFSIGAIWDGHPMLYFNIQGTEKYSIAACNSKNTIIDGGSTATETVYTS